MLIRNFIRYQAFKSIKPQTLKCFFLQKNEAQVKGMLMSALSC